jgi:hypothetical protein
MPVHSLVACLPIWGPDRLLHEFIANAQRINRAGPHWTSLQARYFSSPRRRLLLNAVRYVELNPVRAAR